MPTISTLVVAVRADIKQFQAGMAEAQASTTNATGAMSSSASKFAGISQLAMGTAAVAAIKFGVDSVKAFEEAQQVMAQTEAVLKSTGGQAGVTAQDVLALATKWQNLSGVQDDAIQSSENLLLTFRDVHNEIGKGNDIFNQATGAILDMSTALNRGAIPGADELKTSTIQLGKALNDPIRGMTALRRIGVSFSESQVETIKRLQESGDLMGAQKVILSELKAEFGGAAKAAGDTFAGQLAKLSANIHNLEEEIGGVLVPRLSLLAGALSDIAQKKLPDANTGVSLFARGLHDLRTASDLLPGSMFGWVDSLGPVQDALERQDAALKLAKGDIENWAGAITNGSLTMDQLRQKLDQSGASVESVNKVITDVRGTMAGWTKDALKAAGAASGFAKMTVEAFDKWRADSVADLNGVQTVLGDLADKAHLTANAILNAFDRQLQAMEDYQKNWQTLLGRRLPDSLAQQLQEMGLSGAGVVAALADANQKKFHQIIDDWKEAQREANQTANAIARIGQAVANLPNSSFQSGTGPAGFKPLPTASGGIVTSPQMRLVGEAGPEAIIPLGSGMLGGLTVIINGDVTGEEVVNKVRDGLLRLGKRNGTTGL